MGGISDAAIRDLLVGVLQQAVEDLRQGRAKCGDGEFPARQWIESDRDDEVFDFRRVCEILDIDHRRVRKELIKKMRRNNTCFHQVPAVG